MIEQEHINARNGRTPGAARKPPKVAAAGNDALTDFQKHFGNHERPVVSTQVHNGEEMIVIENSIKRAFYTVNIQLVKLINLREEN